MPLCSVALNRLSDLSVESALFELYSLAHSLIQFLNYLLAPLGFRNFYISAVVLDLVESPLRHTTIDLGIQFNDRSPLYGNEFIVYLSFYFFR